MEDARQKRSNEGERKTNSIAEVNPTYECYRGPIGVEHEREVETDYTQPKRRRPPDARVKMWTAQDVHEPC